MAKFHKWAKGNRARKLFELPLLAAVDTGGEGTGTNKVTVALVPLFGGDEAEVLESTRAFAKAHGVDNPKPGEPLYERGLCLYTVLRTVMDHEVPDRNEPFFESAEQILKFLDPGRISLLFHAQRAWQAKCAPPPGTMNPVEYIRHVAELAHAADEEDRTGEMYEIPFDVLPLETLLRFTRRLAKQFSSWAFINSRSGSGTPDESQSSTSSDEDPKSTPPERSTSTEARSGEEAPQDAPSAPEASP